MQVSTLLAPNPGPFTGEGTNTYILADAGEALVIDPGPDDERHLDRVVERLQGMKTVAVAITHGHPDHAPGAAPLAGRLQTRVLAAGPGAENGGLADGDEVMVGHEPVAALYTPGHSVDHFCFQSGSALFAGDLMMTGSTVVIDDLADYLASLERVAALDVEVVYPGHGGPIAQPRRAVAAIIEHRHMREAEILAAIDDGFLTIASIVARVYAPVDPQLHPLAAASVAAHLRKLAGEGRVAFVGPEDGWDMAVRLVEEQA